MRELADAEARRSLRLGDDHYLAYVGPPSQYDFMGATQFRLLCALGLRAQHKLLDFGCGSLRGGRLLIPYLDPGCYFGLEPNKWLVDEGIANQVGQSLVDKKKPTFLYHDTFSVDQFGVEFDFILAQSIFSHSGSDIVGKSLRQFAGRLKDDGLILATFIESNWGAPESQETGWFYPGNVKYRPATVRRLANSAGLEVARLSWYHPRQRWYVFAKSRRHLPSAASRLLLNGATLSYPGVRASYHLPTRVWEEVQRQIRPVGKMLRRRLIQAVRSSR